MHQNKSKTNSQNMCLITCIQMFCSYKHEILPCIWFQTWSSQERFWTRVPGPRGTGWVSPPRKSSIWIVKMAAEPLSSWVQKSPAPKEPQTCSILILVLILSQQPYCTSTQRATFCVWRILSLRYQWVRRSICGSSRGSDPSRHINTCNIIPFLVTQSSSAACGRVTSDPVYW